MRSDEDVTELSDAIAADQQYAGLTAVECAAAKSDLHMSTCDQPFLEDCEVCQVKLAEFRKLIASVRPVVEQEATKPLRDRLQAAELVCGIFGACGGRNETERDRAATQAWQDWHAAYGKGGWPGDDVVAELARRRDEIRAATLARIRVEGGAR